MRLAPPALAPLAALLLALAAPVPAAAENAAVGLSAGMKRVVVFKDGYCLFEKTCRGRLDDAGRTFLDGVPGSMVLGSFFAVPKEGRVVSLTAKQEVVRRDGREEIRKKLLVEFDKASAGKDVELTLQYYAPGIRWIPAYRVGLGEGETAAVTMQAELVNEAEDLNGIPVDLVVGVPNFRFKASVSPMCLEPVLRNGLGAAPAAPARGRFGADDDPDLLSNAVMSQRMMHLPAAPPVPPEPPDPSRPPAVPPELTGEGSQDLYVYRIPAVDLKAGERAIMPILSAEVPFRHLYTWDVRLKRPDRDAIPGAAPANAPLQLSKNEIWHLVELVNKTEEPWTTGPALMMDRGLPLCQELLGYTPVGGRTQVPITIAVDLAGAYIDEETGRDPNATVFNGRRFVKVSKKGTLRVTNMKRTAVDLMVTFHVGGNARTASDGGKITLSDHDPADWANFRGEPALTGHSAILWGIKLPPGEMKEVSCEYDYFID